VYTLLVVLVGWVLFAIETLSGIAGYLGAMAGATGVVLDRQALYLGRQFFVLFLFSLVASVPFPHMFSRALEKSKTGIGIALYRFGEKLIPAALLLVSIAGIVEASYNPFLYFRF
jgi:alginate O-acetyltransferase complex protein AlgI